MKSSTKPNVTPIAPVMISDRTCEAVIGVPWRTLRVFLQERAIPYQRVGRRPVVRVDVVLKALDGGESTWCEADVIRSAAGCGGGK